MKVERTTGPGTAHSIRKKKTDAADGGFFALLDSTGDTAAVSAAAPPSLHGMGVVFPFQDDDQTALREERTRHGEELLDQLDQLKLDLLGGALSPRTVRELAAKARREQEKTDDPALESILAEIETRAAVELAKLEAGNAPKP